jgi:hypothetical protein
VTLRAGTTQKQRRAVADLLASDDGKRDVRVYDYAGLNVPMLARMFDRRCRGYEAIGYRILLPASVRLHSHGTLTNSGRTSPKP